ncbi:MAG: hypothetical protein ACTSU5_16050 [Promethearchaeota archaeon]
MPINSDEFALYLKNLATMRDYPFIADSFLNFHLEKCKECEYDRMICAISPKCFRRYFLTILIKNGIRPGDVELPEFCYSQHLSNIQRYLAGKRTLYPPFDSLVFMKDFFKLVFPKEERVLSRKLDTGDLDGLKSELVRVVEKEDVIISMGGDFAVLVPPGKLLGPEENLFFLDFRRKYVIVDPRKEEIFFKSELEVLFQALSKAYGIPVKFLDEDRTPGSDGGGVSLDEKQWFVDFHCGIIEDKGQVEQLNVLFMENNENFILSASEVRLIIRDDDPREVHVVLNLSMEKGKFSIEKERISFDKVKKLFQSCKDLQNFLSPEKDN